MIEGVETVPFDIKIGQDYYFENCVKTTDGEFIFCPVCIIGCALDIFAKDSVKKLIEDIRQDEFSEKDEDRLKTWLNESIVPYILLKDILPKEVRNAFARAFLELCGAFKNNFVDNAVQITVADTERNPEIVLLAIELSKENTGKLDNLVSNKAKELYDELIPLVSIEGSNDATSEAGRTLVWNRAMELLGYER